MKTDELVKRLLEYAEWARANEWEVPITLADALEAAADTIEHLDNEAADKIEVQAGLLKYGSNKIHDLEHELDAMKRIGWISVKDRLPEDGEGVLALVSGKCGNVTFESAYELAEYSKKDGWILCYFPEFADPDVSHWMPLPEPPKEDEA